MLRLAPDLIPRLYDTPAISEMRYMFMGFHEHHRYPAPPNGAIEGPQSDNYLTNKHVEQRTASHTDAAIQHNLLPPSRDQVRIPDINQKTILLCSVHASYVQNHKSISASDSPTSFAETTHTNHVVAHSMEATGKWNGRPGVCTKLYHIERSIDIIRSKRGV